MALFFRSAPSLASVAKTSFEQALLKDPLNVTDASAEASTRAAALQSQTAAAFSWGRLAVAIALLLALLLAAIYSAQDKNLEALYQLLLHSFELILGAVIGLLTGEAMHR